MSMIAHIKFPTHSAHITHSDECLITVFKYTQNHCEYDQFTDQFEAADYLFKPLDSWQYIVSLEQD